MNRKYKYNLQPKYFLMFATIILVIIIFTSYRFPDLYAPVRGFFNSCFVPAEKGMTTIGNSMKGMGDKFDDVAELQKENDNLKSQYDSLKAKYDQLLQDSYELENLKALFELSEKYSEYDTVGAHIIATDTTGYNGVFTIDKGTDNGLKEGMNVIAGHGLVGIVTDVGKDYATVRSIIDNNSNVSATILKSSASCIVSGDISLMDKGYVLVSEIPLSGDNYNNYQVVTSEISSKYLPGILIGYISNVYLSKDGLTMEGSLIPAVDFSHLDTVLVITTLKESTEEVTAQ